jgi:hypothetical protein
MISQIRETLGVGNSDLLHMVILDAKSGNILVFCQRSILDNSLPYYLNSKSNERRRLLAKMAILMSIVEPMKPFSLDESVDEVDMDDSISDDEEDDV